MRLILFLILTIVLTKPSAFSSDLLNSLTADLNKPKFQDLGQIHGNFSIISQYYMKDSTINAQVPDEKLSANSFMNLIYTKNNLEIGIRFESYQNRLLGFAPGYVGNGFPYKYARYRTHNFDITVGNFYEQFGNGQILRSYFEPGFGIDNSIEGVKIKYNNKGFDITGLIGQQRNYFTIGSGIIRGLDLNMDINTIFKKLESKPLRVILGGSVVSKFQKDENTLYTLPENTLAYSLKANINYKRFNINGEYTYKLNDPSADNNFSFRSGQNLFLTTSYSQKGFGISLSARSLDNMFFRSDRNNRSVFPELYINFIPTLTKQHTYNLLATLYPYAVQYNGEFCYQGDLIYKFKKGTFLGGKYGTTVQLNASFSTSIDTSSVNDEKTERKLYKGNIFKPGNTNLWHDINIEIGKKISKSVKVKFTYQNLFYNISVIRFEKGEEDIRANTFIADVLYRINKEYAIRFEGQNLFTKEDKGNWATFVVEFTKSPHWFINFINQYNYGNKNIKINYPTLTLGYIQGSTRFSLAFGKQREGIFCAGGVCRVVPASNGITLSLTSRF